MKYNLRGHPRSYKTTLVAKIILAHSFMDRFWWKFVWMLISWRHNLFMKLFINELKCHLYVMEKFCDIFTLRPSDLITTLTYVLMFKYCPCFLDYFRSKDLGNKTSCSLVPKPVNSLPPPQQHEICSKYGADICVKLVIFLLLPIYIFFYVCVAGSNFIFISSKFAFVWLC